MATSLHAKAGRLPSGVDGRDPSANRRRGQSRPVGGIATIHAGAAPTATLISVAGTGAVRGMATIRDKLGHCLHDSFTVKLPSGSPSP